MGVAVISQNTPCQIKLKRGDGYFRKGVYKLVVEKAGYQTFETKIVGMANGWYIGGNIFLGGLIGWLIVDPATGAMWTLIPSEISPHFAFEHTPADFPR